MDVKLELVLILICLMIFGAISDFLSVYEDTKIRNGFYTFTVTSACHCRNICRAMVRGRSCSHFSLKKEGSGSGDLWCFVAFKGRPEWQLVPETGSKTYVYHKKYFLTKIKQMNVTKSMFEDMCGDFNSLPGYIMDTYDYDDMRKDVKKYIDNESNPFWIPLFTSNQEWGNTGETISQDHVILVNSVSDYTSEDCHILTGPIKGHYTMIPDTCLRNTSIPLLCRHY